MLCFDSHHCVFWGNAITECFLQFWINIEPKTCCRRRRWYRADKLHIACEMSARHHLRCRFFLLLLLVVSVLITDLLVGVAKFSCTFIINASIPRNCSTFLNPTDFHHINNRMKEHKKKWYIVKLHLFKFAFSHQLFASLAYLFTCNTTLRTTGCASPTARMKTKKLQQAKQLKYFFFSSSKDFSGVVCDLHSADAQEHGSGVVKWRKRQSEIKRNVKMKGKSATILSFPHFKGVFYM